MLKRLLIAVSLVLLLGALSSLATAQEQDPQQQLCFQKGGFLDNETGRCQIETGLNMEIAYPTELADFPFVLEVIDTELATLQDTFLSNFVEFGLEFPSPPWQLAVEPAVMIRQDGLISVNLSIYEYMGGANPNGRFQSYVFNPATQSLVGLSSVFAEGTDYLNTLSSIAQTQKEAEFGEGALFLEGLEPTPENFRHFTLSEDTLTLYFDEYQIAPGAAGPQTVSIPLSELSAILAPGFAP